MADKPREHAIRLLDESAKTKGATLYGLKHCAKKVEQAEITYEQFNNSVERFYYWLLEFVENLGYELEKSKEEITASEMSAFWGQLEQRKAVQQEKVAQYLGTIGGMIKSLFQLLRSLRIMDERFEYYKKAKEGDKAAEIALKGIWVDMVEGGAKNPASVYGLAQQVGFTILPDLFFEVTPPHNDQIKIYDWLQKTHVDVNRKVLEVLSRKLFQYSIWRDKTEKEIDVSKLFHLKYLRQHYDTIKLYISWIRPYLTNIPRLQAQQNKLPGLLAFSEGAVIELELLGIKKQTTAKVKLKEGVERLLPKGQTAQTLKYQPLFFIEFLHQTRPTIAYQEEYQRGAVHVGRTTMRMSTWVVTEEIYKWLKDEKDKEDFEIIVSLNASMDALKDELFKYLKEAGEVIKEEQKLEEEAKKKTGKTLIEILFSPVDKVTKYYIDSFKALFGIEEKKEKEGEKKKEEPAFPDPYKGGTWKDKQQFESAKKIAKDDLEATRKTIKDAFQMINW